MMMTGSVKGFVAFSGKEDVYEKEESHCKSQTWACKKFTSGVLYYLNKGLRQAPYEYSYTIAFPK